MRIERWHVERDGPLSEVAVQRKIESLRFTVTSRLYAAERLELPILADRVCVLALVRGLIKLVVDGQPFYLAPGDIAFVPPGASRSLELVAPSAPLFFEAQPLETD